MSRLLLAPMEGVADFVMRDVLTSVGGYDGCVSEFVRVTGSLLPARTYERETLKSATAATPPAARRW